MAVKNIQIKPQPPLNAETKPLLIIILLVSRTVDTVAIAAGACLISAVVGYLSCISYRRFLQRKYGSSQILNHEDVYDTTDLKYFEI
ncbi:hypothetical protein Phum_PHUM407810 [Pediculus humanus corporis]|uniref:Uncharacterized protein n=1 Tax=Pediculus humanus subsp. corporis TaxID=121224 RepID=E0VRZ7_PEDHC|nr:uncharacterized protein Phum_PHUM407810 [Pediculus humanus corporis]EEB16153.1 hypothetical protein Phum_PHUM407810 [Pediculus humanus corporis]